MQPIHYVFANDHPTRAGHFPGNPIIPGATILREVGAALVGASGQVVRGFPWVKFLHPVRPGDAIAIEWTRLHDGAVRFACILDASGAKAVTGAMLMGPP
jgi:3-hydroxymyristoyl/3-hydroxydecanoyl-(acyl carrier protein) dehydratase